MRAVARQMPSRPVAADDNPGTRRDNAAAACAGRRIYRVGPWRSDRGLARGFWPTRGEFGALAPVWIPRASVWTPRTVSWTSRTARLACVSDILELRATRLGAVASGLEERAPGLDGRSRALGRMSVRFGTGCPCSGPEGLEFSTEAAVVSAARAEWRAGASRAWTCIAMHLARGALRMEREDTPEMGAAE